MNALNFDDEQQLEAALKEVVKAIAPPTGLKATMRQQLFSPMATVSVLPHRKPSWARQAWVLVLGGVAAIIIAVAIHIQSPSTAWSQVVQAVRSKPWTHIKVAGGKSDSRELWISLTRKIAASRNNEVTRFDDFEAGIRFEYDVRKKKLYRLSLHDHDARERASIERLFQAIFRGDATLGTDFLKGLIVNQRQRTVTERGRRWILYELELSNPNEKDPSHIGTLVIRVDPVRKLPELMTSTFGKEKLGEATFDYPAEGPADIFALGVPHDSPVDDRLPPPDLERIIKTIQQNRRGFGDYLAIVGGNDVYQGDIVHVIRCKGDKLRIDEGPGDTKHVESASDMEKWWQARGREILLQGSILSDGCRVYHHDLDTPKARWEPLDVQITHSDGRAVAEEIDAGSAAAYFVELLAYPPRLDTQQLASEPCWTTHFDPKGANGPPGSVRVELLVEKENTPNDRDSYHKEEFWLQPKYGYALVKHVVSDCPAVDEDPKRKVKALIYEYDEFHQTPRGVWYPTIARWKNAPFVNNDKPGSDESRDQVTYFHLDFAAELPDELFRPDWQGDLLTGIHFTQHDDKRAPDDLGRIRPPGGAPVPVLKNSGEYSVDGLNKVRARLEAATASGEFEKWADELERIIDTKLKDGIPSMRQALRTDFAIHMSVAFDGLKWNAKSADKLFQRAQTLPASEAKVWKEAFEVLFKKKIGQTETTNLAGGPAWFVPFVLIPVDALYEGQKFSAERAKKYLTRLKQLTADDVTLWIEKVDEFGGTNLDAAMNIILLDDYFDKETFQRDKLKAAIEAKKK